MDFFRQLLKVSDLETFLTQPLVSIGSGPTANQWEQPGDDKLHGPRSVLHLGSGTVNEVFGSLPTVSSVKV